MAIDNHMPVQTVPTSSSSSSSSPITKRRQLVQVATNNSSTFIQFPINTRQSALFIPTYRSRTTRVFPCTTDIQSVSNHSKSSSNDQQAKPSQQKVNPILNNSLLNHRKEQPKSLPMKNSTDFSQTTRLCLSSKPLRNDSNDYLPSANRAHTAPFLDHQTESNISDNQIIPEDDENNDQEETPRLDQNKYDYIARWLYQVEQAKSSNMKRPKTRFIPA